MSSNHLILCRPLLLPPSFFPSTRVFSSESVLRIRWPKYWSFSCNISPFNEHSGLISFRICSFLNFFNLFFSHATWHAGCQFRNQGWDPHPPKCQCRVCNHGATRQVALLTCSCADPVMATLLTSLTGSIFRRSFFSSKNLTLWLRCSSLSTSATSRLCL